METFPAYVSEMNSNCEKQNILLIIPNVEKAGWHYLTVKKYLDCYTEKHKGDIYCLNFFHSYKTENKLQSHQKVCEYKHFCGIVMPSEKGNILKFNQYKKSGKMRHIIYADLKSLIKKIYGCASNLEKSSKTKVGEHIPFRY